MRYGGLIDWLVHVVFKTTEWGLGQKEGEEKKNGHCIVLGALVECSRCCYIGLRVSTVEVRAQY